MANENASLDFNNLSVLSENNSDFYSGGYDYSGLWELYETFETVQLVNRRYINFIVMLASLVGNVLILLILSRKGNRQHTTSVYLMNLAVSDLTVAAGSAFAWANYHVTIKGTTLLCRASFILRDVSNFSSTWFLCVIAIERAISVLKPHKVKTICTVRRAKLISIGIWLFIIVLFGSFRQILTTKEFHFQV